MGFTNIGSALIFGFRISLESIHKFLHLEAHPHERWEKPTFSQFGESIDVEAYTHEIRTPNLYGYDDMNDQWDERNQILRDGKMIAEVSSSKEDVLVHEGGTPFEYISYLQFKEIAVGDWHSPVVDPQEMIEMASEVKQEDIDYAVSFLKEKGIELLDEKPVWFLTKQDDY